LNSILKIQKKIRKHHKIRK